MELITFTFTAGETKRFQRAGRYLEVISSSVAINISLTDASGGTVDYAHGALSGLYMEGEFSAITIYSATAQSIELLVTDGRGGSRRQPGNVRVIDEITDALTTVSYQAGIAVTSLVWNPLLPAANNLRGAIVRQISMGGTPAAGGSMNLQLVAAKSQPPAGSTGYTVPAQRLNMAAAFDAAGSLLLVSDSRLNKLLPAGWGVYLGWEITGVNAVTAPNAQLGYELL